jgi:hypothetical protein
MRIIFLYELCMMQVLCCPTRSIVCRTHFTCRSSYADHCTQSIFVHDGYPFTPSVSLISLIKNHRTINLTNRVDKNIYQDYQINVNSLPYNNYILYMFIFSIRLVKHTLG